MFLSYQGQPNHATDLVVQKPGAFHSHLVDIKCRGYRVVQEIVVNGRLAFLDRANINCPHEWIRNVVRKLELLFPLRQRRIKAKCSTLDSLQLHPYPFDHMRHRRALAKRGEIVGSLIQRNSFTKELFVEHRSEISPLRLKRSDTLLLQLGCWYCHSSSGNATVKSINPQTANRD